MHSGLYCAVLLLIACIGVSAEKVEVVECSSTAGEFSIELHEEWSPLGVSRFKELVNEGFFDDQVLYRVIPGFLVQFGVAADPEVMREWSTQTFVDEPKKVGFEHGTVSYAGSGTDSRSCHIFIAMQPNGRQLGSAPHETPIGRISAGIEMLETLQRNFHQAGYSDLTSLQGKIGAQGNAAAEAYPKLDRIQECKLINEKEL